MGACATKPKVSKENENAPLTRDVEAEEKKELVDGDVMEKETSGAGAEEKDDILLKEEVAKETEQIKLEQPVEDEIVLVESKKAEKPAESTTTPPAATEEEVKEAKQEEAEEKAEAETEATVVVKEEEVEEEFKGAVTENSAVEVKTKATGTRVLEVSSESKTV